MHGPGSIRVVAMKRTLLILLALSTLRAAWPTSAQADAAASGGPALLQRASVYEPTYFLPAYYSFSPDNAVYGNTLPNGQNLNRLEVKFQISFKVAMASSGLAKSVYAAYTQRSYWQFYRDSAFFRETNYQPELLVAPDNRWNLGAGWDIGFRVSPYVHQSNGRGGSLERSWNRTCADLIFERDRHIREPVRRQLGDGAMLDSIVVVKPGKQNLQQALADLAHRPLRRHIMRVPIVQPAGALIRSEQIHDVLLIRPFGRRHRAGGGLAHRSALKSGGRRFHDGNMRLNLIRYNSGLVLFFQLFQNPHKRVDFRVGVIKSQGRANGAFVAQSPQDRLRTVMARPHRDAVLVEMVADLLRFKSVEDERQDARFRGRSANAMQTGHGSQAGGGVFQQLMFVGGNGR